ncbi:50S ribosomal protein L11 methyltransferase [Algimonas porphyrae]|uniref:Ribosomal protein L11 methyltransferase n=1 Tax=Algimonas porphyrae TaxID=1128113 RepID=A0ABQ5UXB5_9PROT|nr:50S ribosomal protein L11 methyltransferase [Algimonas porphyrae]GLQ19352.1 ribosomal protein L11 methyltransferase [Algimonas porphyrae]
MSRPYALTIRSPRDSGYDLAERLGFDDVTEALAVSVFDDGPDAVSVQALYATRDAAHAARQGLSPALEAHLSQLPDEDWVGLSQSGLPPIDAGRFIVHGSHDTPELKDRIPIRIDAGQAFGTGHHGTTKGCLMMLDALHTDGLQPDAILDLGTGAGVLAIAAAKLWPHALLLATDIDPVAVNVAVNNAALNDTAFDALTADGFDADALRGRDFDLVISNILAGPLRELAPDIARAMRPGARAILSGILDEQADWVADAFRQCGLTVTAQDSLDGWTSLLASHP